MFRRLLSLPLIVAAASVCLTTSVSGSDWLTMPSSYTHDNTGARTTQFSQATPPVSRVVNGFQSSGYRQYRSTIQYGQAADNYHKVEKWGAPVRPYGEWRFPFRPYSSPYAAWGAPLAGFGGRGFYPGFPRGYPVVGTPANAGLNPAAAAGPAQGFPAAGVVPGAGGFQGYGPGGASLTPYPHLPSSGYLSPPYYDGYHPNYGQRPRLNDEQFYRKPTQ